LQSHRPAPKTNGCGCAAAALVGLVCLIGAPARAQDSDGISSWEISRCAGKLGSEVREGDQAFPLFSLDGSPWMSVDRSARKVDGVSIAATVTGTGTRHRRRGQVVNFRFTCLIDDTGQAVKFMSIDLLPERGEALPPASIVRGVANYVPKLKLPRGAELRVQLLDDVARDRAREVLTEVVVRSSWEAPIPFVMRLPMDTRLDGRKPIVTARLALGLTTLYRLKEAYPISPAEPHKPIELVLDAVVASSP